jgi:hypothetical protein
MVNRLLTISIKVNIEASAESQLKRRGEQDEQGKDEPGLLDLASRWWLGRRSRLSDQSSGGLVSAADSER